MTENSSEPPDLVDLSADFEECEPGQSIPIGLKDGRPVDVTMVPRGKACGCICPACHGALVAAKGEKLQYFRHLQRDNCTTGAETGVHLLAKEILAEHRWLRIPMACAKHGNRPPRLVVKEQVWPFQTAEIEPVLSDKDGRRIRPDLIVRGEVNATPFALLIEIRVRHKQDARKRDEVKRRGLAAIEIDLSRQPPIATREYYRSQILDLANRHWIFNRHAERERIRMLEEEEERYGGIAARIGAASDDPLAMQPDNWVEEVEDAGLGELIDLEIKGGECFAVTGKIWQAVILHRYVLSPRNLIFDPQDALVWLEGEGLLKPVFAELVHDDDRDRIAHLRDTFRVFREPCQVVSNYAGELRERGVFVKMGKAQWQSSTEFRDRAIERHQRVIRWRLRMADLRREFHAIKTFARRGDEMAWDRWLETPLSAYQSSVPRELLLVSEPQFQLLLEHLRQLRAMLEPGAPVPEEGLLELPLEPERDERLTERREAAEMRERRAAAEVKITAGTRTADERTHAPPADTGRPPPPSLQKSPRGRASAKLYRRTVQWFRSFRQVFWR
jgi:hypothetical protein